MNLFKDRSRIHVGGQWIDSTADSRIDVLDPATSESIGMVADGTAEDVDRAVRAARAAFADWSQTTGPERAAYLRKAHELLRQRMADLGHVVSRDLGMPIDWAQLVQIGLPAANLANFADLAEQYDFDGETVGNSLVVREPVGVVGAITPWNYPLHQVVLKVGAAIAAGCTVVLKPSEVVPLISYELIDIFDEIGLPDGVVNLVSGVGPVVGEAIASHPDVDMVSFTGSNVAGKRVAALAATTVKKVGLELGGKSAAVVLPDADTETAATQVVNNCMLNSGQTCSALTRMLVPQDRIDEYAAVAARVAGELTIGDPQRPGIVLGPLVSARQRERVARYIETGIEEAATLTLDGRAHDQAVGNFIGPTIFSDVTPQMTIAKEEIFGPVLSVMAYRDVDEAIDIANGTDFGLSGGVWSADEERALAVARRLRTGQVQVNSGGFNTLAPFGGYKQSGTGREAGRLGLEEFLEVKAIQR
ncbi:aldehyde dehydrogenase family protein [Aeromicrobium sp. PE09-221]|uniref:aldehyde dehydrogenase family protein n=1 Tax=Actinomycetes TaxID=1760 RepID=UPI000B3E5844|nr:MULTISPECIES: aldehyde dehydrogenase family protein [Actinomycetes]MCT2139250.1 aldehyde dehydrogenase family protein [Dietzia cinnamea]OUZ10265.1 aldehyde dehydrogenase family protein [Aeromicrobium sp. PE09-221]